jgi:serine protease Do
VPIFSCKLAELNGVDISNSANLQEKIGTLSPGDKVQLTVLRDGDLKTYNLTLKGDESVKLATNTTDVKEVASSLGATFAPLNDATKKKYGLSTGVIVTNITQGKVFDLYDMPKGTIITSVNGKGVNNNEQVIAALKQDPKMVSLQGIVPDGSRFRVTFPIK